MNILVTGATGFVGRLLISRLRETRPKDKIAAFLLPGEQAPESFGEGIEILRGDLRDAASVDAAVRGRDLVFHVAAYISYWVLDAELMRSVNAEGTRAVVEACIARKVERLVHVSSVGAIGFRRDGELSYEDQEFNWPESFGYMTTKRDGQRIVEAAVRDRGLDAVIVNPASVMGPGDPLPLSAHNRLYGNMYKGKLFFGTFTGGLAVVDVRDLVEVILAAANKGRKGEAYLAVGANAPYSLVLKHMAKSAGKLFIPFPVPPFLVRFAGWAAELLSRLTQKRPLVTAAYGRLSGWTAYYGNRKSVDELGAAYRRLEDTIADGCRYYEAAFLGRGGA